MCFRSRLHCRNKESCAELAASSEAEPKAVRSDIGKKLVVLPGIRLQVQAAMSLEMHGPEAMFVEGAAAGPRAAAGRAAGRRGTQTLLVALHAPVVHFSGGASAHRRWYIALGSTALLDDLRAKKEKKSVRQSQDDNDRGRHGKRATTGVINCVAVFCLCEHPVAAEVHDLGPSWKSHRFLLGELAKNSCYLLSIFFRQKTQEDFD